MTYIPIRLLPAKHFREAIETIETLLPGYWYSISQKHDEITISVGASLYCPLGEDRFWSRTPEGDSGIVVSISTVERTEEINIVAHILLMVKLINEKRNSFLIESTNTFPKQLGEPRIHGSAALGIFQRRYEEFLAEFVDLTQRGVVINEVYIGACHLSVDVSIRGDTADGETFDYSHDYKGDMILAYSLNDALMDLYEDLNHSTTVKLVQSRIDGDGNHDDDANEDNSAASGS